MNTQTALDRPAMGDSEAAAMRKRLLWECGLAHERLKSHLQRNHGRGCQRRGPRHRRTVKSLLKYLKPAILSHGQHADGTYVFVALSRMDYGRLGIVFIAIHPKRDPDILPFNLKITAHAMDRFIQFYRVREFDRLDEYLRAVLGSLARSAWNQETLSGRIDLTADGALVGHMVADIDEDGINTIITFVGNRSYSPTKKALIRNNRKMELAK